MPSVPKKFFHIGFMMIVSVVLLAKSIGTVQAASEGEQSSSVAANQQTSELSLVLSAALHDYVSKDARYSDLYQKYLGVRRNPPVCSTEGRWIPLSKVTPGSTLDQVLKKGVIRFGFLRHEPYYFTDEKGHDTGFEYELGSAIVGEMNRHYPQANLKLKWVEQNFELPGGGQDNIILYDKLLPGLQEDKYDVAFSGLIVMPDRPVSATCPTMDFFWDALYSGKDAWKMQSIQNTDRKTLVRFLAGKPSVTILSTGGGPSEEVANELVKEIAAAGGVATATTATVPGLMNALAKQTVHIVLGDAIALSGLANEKGFAGLNLNIALKDGYSLAPITRLDPAQPLSAEASH